jgi:hypothetical protein
MIRSIVSKNKVRLPFFAIILGVLATGCQTYQQQNHVIQYWRQGNLTNAVVEATKMADKNATGKDAIIWRLEQATVLRANGQFEDSNKAFNQAEEQMNKYSEAAKVRVGEQAGALLSNQANLPYEGHYYDGIMLNTYKALNYLSLGDIEKARPEIIRAYQRQQDAVEENKKRIEKVQTEAASHTNSAAIQKAQNDSKFQAAFQTNYAVLDSLKSYSDYVNPFTVYLDGLFFMANAADASDLERAHKSFERIGGFLGDNDYIREDLATVDGLMNGKRLEPTTYVIFETGCAPVRDQIRIDVPIILSRLSYVGAAFPTLRFQDGYVPSLTVTANGTNTTTLLLSSMDSVIGLDFKNEMPLVMTKTIASTVTKAVAAYAINEAMNQQSALAGLFSQLATAAYQASVNVADTRTWTTLPKEFQFCRVPTPADHKLDLATADGLQKTSVTVGDGTINVVYVKSINPVTPLLVSQLKLSGSSVPAPVAAQPAVPVQAAPAPTPAPAPTESSTNSPTTTTTASTPDAAVAEAATKPVAPEAVK